MYISAVRIIAEEKRRFPDYGAYNGNKLSVWFFEGVRNVEMILYKYFSSLYGEFREFCFMELNDGFASLGNGAQV